MAPMPFDELLGLVRGYGQYSICMAYDPESSEQLLRAVVAVEAATPYVGTAHLHLVRQHKNCPVDLK